MKAKQKYYSIVLSLLMKHILPSARYQVFMRTIIRQHAGLTEISGAVFPCWSCWSCLFPWVLSLHLRLSSWPWGLDETAGPPCILHENQTLEFQGSTVLFVSPLFLISSFNTECGSRIAAFEVISIEDFFSFPAPLHTPHRKMG